MPEVTCKGICEKYKPKESVIGGNKYKRFVKRCQICEIFIEWQGLCCPCCAYKLRMKPRNGRKDGQECSICHSKISYWGKLVHWFMQNKEIICVFCYDKTHPPKCTMCGKKESIDRKGNVHWFRPSIAMNLCQRCYDSVYRVRNKKRHLEEKRKGIQPILLIKRA